ncbi:MAG: hypothetical protein K2V38_05220 [Gemmataceae bacterium]|nr:hypothetical protein [Gemmataceae bacterium]
MGFPQGDVASPERLLIQGEWGRLFQRRLRENFPEFGFDWINAAIGLSKTEFGKIFPAAP